MFSCFKGGGGGLLQLSLSRGLSVCVLCLFSINTNSPTQSLSHIRRAPRERADLREARVRMCMCCGGGGGGGGGGDEWNCAGVALKPMGMALSVSGNHFVRHTTLILLVSLLPSACRGAGPRLRLRGAGAGDWGGVGGGVRRCRASIISVPVWR